MNTNKELHGVHWDAEKQKWCASIEADGHRRHIGYSDGQQYYLGYYTSKVVAARTRDVYILQNGLPHKLNDESLRGCVHEY